MRVVASTDAKRSVYTTVCLKTFLTNSHSVMHKYVTRPDECFRVVLQMDNSSQPDSLSNFECWLLCDVVAQVALGPCHS